MQSVRFWLALRLQASLQTLSPALGARRSRIISLLLRQGLLPVAIGMALGAMASLGLGVALSGVLFGVGPADPLSLVVASAALGLAATVACLVPAHRAGRVDPAVVLRTE